MVLDIRRLSRFSFKGGFTLSATFYGSRGFISMKEMDREGATRLPASLTDGGTPVLPPVKVSIGRRFSSSTVSTPEIEKKYVHHVYDAIAPHFSSTRFAKWPKVSSFLNSLPLGSLVLDAGCGNGKYLGLNPNCYFIGCDISGPLIKICYDRGNEVLVADAVNLPYRTGYGDAAISIAVLHHLSTESRRRKAVEELLRVVKKGGLVLITVWAREQEDGSLLNKWTPLNQKYLEEWVGPGSPRVRSPSSPLTLESIPETEENCPKEPLKESSLKFSDVSSLEEGDLNSESADSSSLTSEGEKGSDDHQEFFVPWHLPYHQAEVSGASANALASGLAKKDDKKGAVVYNRYYHVFSEGELERYARYGGLVEARNVFDKMSERNVVSWTAMLNGYLKFGYDDEAIRHFIDFIGNGFSWSSKTFVCVLNMCGKRVDIELGKQVHSCIVKGGFSGLILNSALLHFYVQCGDMENAVSVFESIKERDVVCWTTMITAYSQHKRGEEAFLLFSRMLRDGFQPNEFTICSVLDSCAEEKELKLARQLHGAIVKNVYKMDTFIGTALVDMYAKCGEMEDSRVLFDGMRKRNTVTWTTVIAGYARNGVGTEAINLFRLMQRRKIFANNLTMVSILRACGLLGALTTGKEVHAQILKNYVQNNLYIGSSLVWLYCRCGDYSAASKVLQDMPLRDVVSWTAMISGCANLGHEHEALEYLKEMLGEGIDPNHFTYSSALKACARLEDIKQGKLIHSSINKNPASSNVFVGSALIHMYAKCGYLSEAIRVFDNMPERNLVSWKAMIIAYAKNGLCREALKLMYRMQAEGIELDDYVFSTVVTECGDDFEWDVNSSKRLAFDAHGSFAEK